MINADKGLCDIPIAILNERHVDFAKRNRAADFSAALSGESAGRGSDACCRGGNGITQMCSTRALGRRGGTRQEREKPDRVLQSKDSPRR